MKEIFQKYREMILYVFWGGCTTLVNIAVFYAGVHFMGFKDVPANVMAWVLSVLFAYVTNRRWVFQSRQAGFTGILREMGSFFSARLSTGLLDTGVIYVFATLLKWNNMAVKIVSNVIVVILNYVLSKLFVFRKKEGKVDEK